MNGLNNFHRWVGFHLKETKQHASITQAIFEKIWRCRLVERKLFILLTSSDPHQQAFYLTFDLTVYI